MGNLKELASMIPGVGKAIKDIDIDDNAFKSIEAIIYSMTPEERSNPGILNGSRRTRIAKGSGTTIQEVNRLLKQFDQTRKMMKMVTSSKDGQDDAEDEIRPLFFPESLNFGFGMMYLCLCNHSINSIRNAIEGGSRCFLLFLCTYQVRNHNPPLEVPETVTPLPNTGCIAVRCLLHFSKTPALPASDPGSIPRSSSLPSELLPTPVNNL